MSEFKLTALTSDLTTKEGLEHAVLQSLHNWQQADGQHGWWAAKGVGT